MKKHLYSIAVLFFIITVVVFNSCKLENKQDISDRLQKAMAVYDEGFHFLISGANLDCNDSIVESFEKFCETILLLEDLPEDMSKDEMHLLSRAYYQLGLIIEHSQIPYLELNAWRRSLYYQQMVIDSAWMPRIHLKIAGVFLQSDADSVLYYLNMAKPYIDTIHDNFDDYIVYQHNLSKVFHYQKKYEECFKTAHDVINFKSRHGMDTKNDSMALGILMYHSPYKLKSKPYLLKVLEIKTNDVAHGAIMMLVENIYEIENKPDSMAFCQQFYKSYTKTNLDRGNDATSMTKLYEEMKLKRDIKINMLREQKNKKKKRLLATISLIVAVTTVASLTYIFRRNKKNFNKQKDIAGNALQLHVQMIYREQKDNMYQEILKGFTSVYPDALDKLKKTYPELTDTELSVCMLSFFSFRVKDIANILKLRENTVSKYKSSIIKKTEAKDITKVFG